MRQLLMLISIVPIVYLTQIIPILALINIELDNIELRRNHS